MTNINAELHHREHDDDSAMCKYCGEHAFDCGCGDELHDRTDDEREEQ